MQMALDLGTEAIVNQSLVLRDRPDQRDVLCRFAGPARLLCGSEDSLCPAERQELMQSLLGGSRRVVVRGAGLLATLEKPEETNAALAAWLEE